MTNRPVANPLIVLREEFDDWAILFNPDTGEAHALNPTSVMIWKLLDGKHDIDSIVTHIRNNCTDVSDSVEKDVQDFIELLLQNGYAGHSEDV